MEGARFELRGPKGERVNLLSSVQGITIGRLSSNDLVVEDATVSRRHASVRYWEGRVEVRDHGSSKGSFINGKVLGGGVWHALPAGAMLRLGRYTFQLEKVRGDSPPDGAPLVSQTALSQELTALAARTKLESESAYLVPLCKAKTVLAGGRGIIRLAQGLPTMVVPDLHGQRDYLMKALSYNLDGTPVLERLLQGSVNLLCLGDGMHGEKRARDRWMQAEKEFLTGAPCPCLETEAVESLGLMKMVMLLKIASPNFFHYLRGNHDEVNNPARKIYKFTKIGESELFRRFLVGRFGWNFVEKWAEFEASLPLMALGDGFVATHSAPGATLTRPEIESRSDRAFLTLAWTNNLGFGEAGPEAQILRANLRELGAAPESHWLVGHCKVDGGYYRAQLGGQLVQINPKEAGYHIVALIPARGGLHPERDIFVLP